MGNPYVAGGQVPDVDDEAPAVPSLTAGAIARSLLDAGAARYREQLADLWRETLTSPSEEG